MVEVPARFWKKCVMLGPDDCWNWTAAIKPNKSNMDYGHFRMNGKSYRAHRLAYASVNGEIPEGLIIRHTCDNTLCINPNHLIVGTHKDNSKDKYDRKRENILRGSAHGRAKYTEEQILQMRQMRKDGMLYREIGEAFGMSVFSAHQRVNRGWKEV